MDITYENRYVAFLDILGFKNMVLQSENDQQMLNLINMALNYTAKIQIENYGQNMPMADLGKQVSVFSDSIVISYDMIRPGSGFFVLLDLVYICNDLLGVGMPVRGGVTVGSLIHDNNKCFGPAMVNAYYLESQAAVYPRILVDPKVIEYDLQYRGINNTQEFEKKFIESLIEQDSDGKIFLDFLSQYNEFNDYETYNAYMVNVRNFIIGALYNSKSNARVFDKYIWLKNYYNSTVSKVYKEYDKFLIK